MRTTVYDHPDPLPHVTESDIRDAVIRLGVKPGDTVLFHSSMKSFGYVEGGPEAVIRGVEAAIGKTGTLAIPTLCQVDFTNSYKTWYMDKPSDVGLITEIFRKLPYVYRSNQATHSVAARGPLAYELTHEHTAYGPHLCPFGDYAFSDSSPWLKLYRMNAHILFLGADMEHNTLKHTIEARLVENLIDGIKDPVKKQELFDKLIRFEKYPEGIWPWYDGVAMSDVLWEKGLIQKTTCGNSVFLGTRAKDTSDAIYEILAAHPEDWYSGAELEWILECREAAR